jgi:hypothetical protein
MGKKTTKTVKVDRSKADEWEKYVEENPEADSISHLIRQSVEKEVNGLYESPQTPSGEREPEISGQVLTTLQQIQTGVSDLEERLSALESVERAEETYSLKKAIWEFLPEEPEEIIDSEVPIVYEDIGIDSLDVITPQQIAQKLGADVGDVRSALDELAESTGQVECSDINFDGNYYWKKEA